jgi:hypothetical protein
MIPVPRLLNHTAMACDRDWMIDVRVLTSNVPVWLFGIFRANWHWKLYSTAVFVPGGEVREHFCYWPCPGRFRIHKFQEKAQPSLLQVVQKVANSTEVPYHPRVVLSRGFFQNFWHGMETLEEWCTLRHEDVVFVGTNLESYVYTWMEMIGIGRHRIVELQGRSVRAGQVFLPRGIRVGWACLHSILGVQTPVQKTYISMYLRKHTKNKLERNIPESIHNELAAVLAQEFRGLNVVSFTGMEPINQLRQWLGHSSTVVGPHGAGLVNVIFCESGTPVVEYLTKEVFRPWQFTGGSTLLHPWWPVLLSSFHNRSEIMASVSVVRAALASGRGKT